MFVEYIVEYVVKDVGSDGGYYGDNWFFVYIKGYLSVNNRENY